MNIGPTWTDERINTLKFHAAGGLTASEIGAEMQITRNAVIGKISRMGISLARSKAGPKPVVQHVAMPRAAVRSAPFRPPPRHTSQVGRHTQIRPSQNSQRRKEVMVIEATEIIDLAPDESPFACTISELDAEFDMHRCRWPLSAPAADMPYCGAPSTGPWCPRHHAIAYKPYPRRA